MKKYILLKLNITTILSLSVMGANPDAGNCECESASLKGGHVEVIESKKISENVVIRTELVRATSEPCGGSGRIYIVKDIYGDIESTTEVYVLTFSQTRPAGCEDCPPCPDKTTRNEPTTNPNKQTPNGVEKERRHCEQQV